MFRLVIFSSLFLATFANSTRRPTQQRIVGGRITDVTELPYVASVRYKNGHECGGSIIGPKHILTAAHCFEKKDPTRFDVRVGSKYYLREGEKVDVAKIISHPNYDTDSVDYDAAVVVLKDPLKFNDKVQSVSLANVEPKEGEMVLISGWGSMKKGKMLSDLLRSTTVPVTSKKYCREKYGGDEEITDRMFCAGYPTGGKDSCSGDSGGPAVVNGKLAGIVSFGDDCGDGNFPGVYTNIASILPWITAQTQ